MSGEEGDGLSAAIIFSLVCDRSCLTDRRHQTEHSPSFRGGEFVGMVSAPNPLSTRRHTETFSFLFPSTLCSIIHHLFHNVFHPAIRDRKGRGGTVVADLLGSVQDLWIASRPPTVSLQGSRIAKIFQSEFSQIQILDRFQVVRV